MPLGRHHGGGGVEIDAEHGERGGAREPQPAQSIRPPNVRREVNISEIYRKTPLKWGENYYSIQASLSLEKL